VRPVAVRLRVSDKAGGFMRPAVRRAFAIAAVLISRGVLVAAGSLDAVEALQYEIGSLSTPRVYEGPPLTLAGATNEALTKNPDLVALRQQIQVMRQRPAQERGFAAPMAEATIWQWPINTLNPANTNMYMFMLGQDIPGHGKRALRAAVGEKDIALAATDVAVRARQVVNDVRQAYASLFIARKAIDVHIASVDLLRQIADVSEAKYTTGRISQQDVLKPVLELSRLHNGVLMFEEHAAIAAARLNVLRDRPPDAAIGPLLEPSEDASLPAVADLQRTALELQPALQRARLEIERAEAELAVSKRDDKPDFSVQAGYMLMPGMTDAWMGRIGVTWPNAPWARGNLDARVAEQTAAVETAKARERAMENTVRLAVQEAYARATSALNRAALLRTTIVPQSRQTLEVSRVAYQTDRVDFQALIDNERTLIDSQLDYYRALTEFEQAVGDLEQAVGTALPAARVIARRQER
jgi:cobalt-zinc-cadmium efflux system outer membrane protein